MVGCLKDCWGKCVESWGSLRYGQLRDEQDDFERYVDFLLTVPLFVTQLPPESVAQVARELKEERFAGGEIVVKEGDLGDALYIVKDGELVATVQTGTHPDGRPSREVRARLGCGDYFGGHALVEKRRNVSTMAAGGRGVLLLSISREQFEALGLHQCLTFPKRRGLNEGWHRQDSGGRPGLLADDGNQGPLSPEDEDYLCEGVRVNPNLRALHSKLLTPEKIRMAASGAHRFVAQPGQEMNGQGTLGHAGAFFVIKEGMVEFLLDVLQKSDSSAAHREGSTSTVSKPGISRRAESKASAEEVVRDNIIADGIQRRRAFLQGIINPDQRLCAADSMKPAEKLGGIPEKSKKGQSLYLPHGNPSVDAAPTYRRTRSQPLKSERFSIGDHVVLAKTGGSYKAKAKRERIQGVVVSLLPNGEVVVRFADGTPMRCRPDEVHHAPEAKVKTHLSPGESFGEISLLFNTYRIGSYRVPADQLEPTVLFAIPHRHFKKCLMPQSDDPKLKEWAQLLHEVQCLAPLLVHERADLASRATGEVSFAPHETIIERGQVRQEKQWYIVASGTALVTWPRDGNWMDPEDQRELELARSDHFGEHALLGSGSGQQVAMATVTAGANGLVCLCFDEEVLRFVAEYAEFPKTKDLDSKYKDRFEEGPITPHTPGKASPWDRRVTPSQKKRASVQTQTQTQHIVEPSKLVTVRLLGSGSFGQVMLQKDPETEMIYALKRISKRGVRKTGTEKHMNMERKIHALLNNQFVITLLGSYKDDQFVYMLMEAAVGGSLEDAVQQIIRHPEVKELVPWVDAVRYYVACISAALDHLHEQSIAHRDLKPENVLLSCDGVAKLCDFGFARFIVKRSYTVCGTPPYMAPEMIDLPHGHDHRVDWFALGVMLFEMLSGQVPFGSGYDIHSIRECQMTMPFPEEVLPASTPAEAEDLTKKLLVQTRKNRLGSRNIGNVRDHNWFRTDSYDIQGIQVASTTFKRGFNPSCLEVNMTDEPAPNLKDIFPPAVRSRSGTDTGPTVTVDDNGLFEDDEVFKELEPHEWQMVNMSYRDGIVTKCNGAANSCDASIVSSSPCAVRLTACASNCRGTLRFGLTSDPNDDSSFKSGYFVALMPYLKRCKAEETSYVAPGGVEPYTITIDNKQEVLVHSGGQPVHRMTPRGTTSLPRGMYAKVFLSSLGDIAQFHAFEEYKEEDHKGWDLDFELPPAVAALKRARDGSSSRLVTLHR